MNEWSVAVEQRHRLGEGLHWEAGRARLWWVDIQAGTVHAWNLHLGEPPLTWRVPERVGWVLPLRRHGEATDPQAEFGPMLLGLQGGVVRWDPGTGKIDPASWIRPWPEGSPLRLNDAKADVSGRIWAGSLNHGDEQRPDGCLMHIDPATSTLKVLDAGYRVANGPAIHPDGQLLLHTDSVTRTIYAFDLDADEGRIDNKRVWKQFHGDEGHPDGMNFDAEGGLWLAHWGGACISRYAPNGDLLRRVALPTSHITNVCFAGPGLDRLFVTSATAGLTARQQADQPLAGAVFEVDSLGIRGLPGLPARA